MYYVLTALLDGPLHGHAIMKVIGEISGGRVKPSVGTLYGILERLGDRGLIVVDPPTARNSSAYGRPHAGARTGSVAHPAVGRALPSRERATLLILPRPRREDEDIVPPDLELSSKCASYSPPPRPRSSSSAPPLPPWRRPRRTRRSGST
ncbi:PadR family transcriptional regulator [Microtetraspora niveoalba]|uniref:PadR family transcriptional regulator n=1 Tax=Microtetraspora niveoalba TaxID=46175 RepID=UPI0014723FED